jgi:uncharacterized protein (DUF433 family)
MDERELNELLPLDPDAPPLRLDEGGAVRVGKSRISLDLVVEQYENGMTPEDMVRAYETLDLADVHAVIAYYLRHLPPNLDRLIVLIASRHDHQDVNVAVGVRRAVRMRSEQNDLVGMEFLRDLTSESPDDGKRNVRATIVARRCRYRQVRTPVRVHRSQSYLSDKVADK